MKKILILLGFSFAVLSFTIFDDTNDIIKALKIGNTDQVSNYFESFIDLSLPAKDEVKNMGKNQASIAFKSFFEENHIKSFEPSAQREAGTTMYLAGKLIGANKSFNITLLLKNKEGKHQITSIRIN